MKKLVTGEGFNPSLPQSFSMEIALVLGLLIVALALFATEKLPVDIVTLLLLVTLVLSGVLTVPEAFSGFSDPIIVVLASIFVIGGAMRETGLLEMIGARLLRVVSAHPARLLPAMMTSVAAISAFMNNTTVTAMFAGPLTGLAKRAGISPSKILMPLAFASILGGTCTLIGTSTNVAVSGYIARHGLAPVGLFEITPIGLVIVAVGLLYMTFFGERLLPDRAAEDAVDDYNIREYLSEIVVLEGSPLAGQNALDSDLSILHFQVLKVIRSGAEFRPDPRDVLRVGDVVIVAGKVENLVKVSRIEGIELHSAVAFAEQDLEPGDTRVAEVLVTPLSKLGGRTLRETDFRHRYGLAVLALYRRGQALHEALGNITLRTGDLLLVQGSQDRLEALQHSLDLAVLEQVREAPGGSRRGWIVLAAFLAAVALSGINLVPLPVAVLCAALVIVLFKCLPMDQIYQSIDFRLLVLIGGMTAFGVAMEKTGAAALLADWTIHLMSPLGAHGVLGGFFILTVILTQPMSNAAAALVVLPVALKAAAQLGLNERTFAIAIMLAASVSLVTPFEPSCVIVYGPGKYRFNDFLKVGGLLTLLLLMVLLVLIPMFWPLV